MARKPVYGRDEWQQICWQKQQAREQRILELAAEGYTDPEIAARMNYATDTVKKIWPDIRLRLGAKNRTHAVAQAIRTGIL